MWQKKRGFLVAVLTIVRTHYAFSQKIATGMNIFFAFKNIYQQCFFAITLIRAGVAVQGPLVSYKYLLMYNFSFEFFGLSLKNLRNVEFLAEKRP